MELYQSLRDAQVEIADRILRVKALLLRSMEQLRFLEKVWPVMHPDHQGTQMEVLRALTRLLKKARYKTQGLIVQGKNGTTHKIKIRRWKHVLVNLSTPPSVIFVDGRSCTTLPGSWSMTESAILMIKN